MSHVRNIPSSLSILAGDCCSSLVPEERVVLGLNAMATSQLTLAKIRKVYSKTDNRSIAKQVRIQLLIVQADLCHG